MSKDSEFSQMPSMLRTPSDTARNYNLKYAYYDTWPLIYESDSLDNDNDDGHDNDEGPRECLCRLRESL